MKLLIPMNNVIGTLLVLNVIKLIPHYPKENQFY